MRERKLTFRDEALADITEAAAWYDARTPGFSAEFMAAVDAAVTAVYLNPERYPVTLESMRRMLLERFPYSLFYLFDDDEIIILGCVHWRQNPESWQYRR